MSMLTEAEPHIRYILSGKPTVEIRSPDCPEELNPFGEIPFETELIKEDIAELRASFLNEVGDHTGEGRITPEGYVRVFNDPSKPLLIEIDFYHPPAEDREEFIKRLVHRFKLYENNIAVKQVVDWSAVGGSQLIVTETILSQEFVTQDHLPSLNYALRVLQQHH